MTDDESCRCGHPETAHVGIYSSCDEYVGHGKTCTCAGYRAAS